ncbi:MAG: DUF1249 domain-containing protein [Chromatiales bacterium]|nr:MAG: DUF1249 domain-containing protein [Chromatiales bacterium]
MIVDTYMVPEGDVCPGSFGGLMALYESNYIKLVQLLGESRKGDVEAVSRAPGDLPLYLSQEAQDAKRYTQDLRLTYLFRNAGPDVADPDLQLRLYLDARMAEVRGWADHHRHGVLLHLRRCYGRELDRRWARNMMLSKWLDYLLERGHSFRGINAFELADSPA